MSEVDIKRIDPAAIASTEERRETAYQNKTLTCDQLVAQMHRLIRIFKEGKDLTTLRYEVNELELLARKAGANLSLIMPDKAERFFARFSGK